MDRYAHSQAVQPYPNFLDAKDGRYKKLQGTMDTRFRKLWQDGVGAEVNHTDIIKADEEDLVWELRILGTSTHLALLRSVFCYNGKVFLLRGGDEHRELKFSQLKRVSQGYIYTEKGSKNCSGGVAQVKIEHKVVPSYASAGAENKERCHVYLLDLYIKKVPSGAPSKDSFYLRPLDNVSDTPGSVWFTSVPIGKKKQAFDNAIYDVFRG